MGPGKPNITRLPGPTPAYALRVGALNTGPRRILLRESLGRLTLSCGVQRLILFLRLEPYDAGLLLGPRTLGALWTGCAILPGKARLPCHPILRIRIREPRDALLPHWARDHFPGPVDLKLGFIEPRARPGLPTGVVRHGAEERDAISTLALDQDLGVRI